MSLARKRKVKRSLKLSRRRPVIRKQHLKLVSHKNKKLQFPLLNPRISEMRKLNRKRRSKKIFKLLQLEKILQARSNSNSRLKRWFRHQQPRPKQLLLLLRKKLRSLLAKSVRQWWFLHPYKTN
jgi:hypothetical protein